MTRLESYQQQYSILNTSYNQIFDALQVLIEAQDSDPQVCTAINQALLIMDNALDIINEEKNQAENTPQNNFTNQEKVPDNNTEEEKTSKKSGFVLSFPGKKK